MKIPPPEGYEWCALYDADCDERGYALQASIIPNLGNIEPSFLVTFGKPHEEFEACRVGHLRKERPELPQEITDAGWEYAESWNEAQPMGFTDWLNSQEIRACMLVCTRRVVPMPKELEEPINKDVFVCWLKVKK